MKCRTARKNFSALLDGEVAPAVAEAVREHLRTCKACAAAWEAMGAADAEAREGLRAVAQGSDLSEAFAPRVIKELAAVGARPMRRADGRKVWRLATSAAGVFLVLVGIVWFLLRTEQAEKPGSVSTTPRVETRAPEERAVAEPEGNYGAGYTVPLSLGLPSVRALAEELYRELGGSEEAERLRLNYERTMFLRYSG